MPPTISVASYIFKRLQQHSVDHVFGVPGDYLLKAIDHVKATGVKWTGTCNELNAGYAADGYARLNGLGALFTTYGVGELSAINAMAGAYAERVPIVHVVGLPQRQHLKSRRLVHHSLGQRSNDRLPYLSMHKRVTRAQFNPLLTDGKAIVDSIDGIISKAVLYRVPVYLPLPSDMVAQQVDAERLDKPLAVSEYRGKDMTEMAAPLILEKLYEAKAPLLLIDRASIDHSSMRQMINEFVHRSRIPTLTMPSGASMVDHSIENYYGVHAGSVGRIDTKPYVDACDLVLAFGAMFSDTQTLGWSLVPSNTKTIMITNNRVTFPDTPTDATAANHSSSTAVEWHISDGHEINLKNLLQKLTRKLDTARLSHQNTESLGNFRDTALQSVAYPDHQIDQTDFYLKLNSYLRPHDVILLANATPILGGRDFVLSDPSMRVIASGLWFSIGHMLPAALGAAMAQQRSPSSSEDAKRGRVILLDGDGSFQVTSQELSTIIHQRLNVTIFIINNEGYAYERLIHNPEEDYHDIAPWDYLSLPAAFGAAQAIKKAQGLGEEYSVDTYTMRTWQDLQDFMEDETFENGFGGKGKRGLKLVDVKMAKTDVPENFKAVFESAGKSLG